MKQVRWALAAVFVVAFLATPTSVVSAKTLVVEAGSVTVQSKVLETHYILVNEQETITRIDSNTANAARPRVFLHEIAPGRERPMSEEVYKQYAQIIPTGKTHVGTVYQRTELPPLPLFHTRNETAKTDFLALISQ